MKCYIAQDILPEYEEKLLSEETTRELEEHLQECSTCREKLARLREVCGNEEERAAVGVEDIKPFKKIRTKMRRNQIVKIIAIVLLVLITGVFGTLSVGQCYPELDCPSFNTLIYRHQARQIAEAFAAGNMKEVLRKRVETTPGHNLETRLFYDVAEHLEDSYQRAFAGKDIRIHVGSLSYSADYYEDGIDGRYMVDITLEVEGENVYMEVSFKQDRVCWLEIRAEQNDVEVYDSKCVLKNGADENSLSYITLDMNLYLDYFALSHMYDVGQLDSVYQPSRWISGINAEIIQEWEKAGDASSGRFGSFFTEDCLRFRVVERRNTDTEYSAGVDRRMYEVLKRCESNDFQLMVREYQYNEDEKKFDAVLYWRVTDQEGRRCMMTKEFYYGPTGYEPVDDTEEIYADDEFEPGLREAISKVFDS